LDKKQAIDKDGQEKLKVEEDTKNANDNNDFMFEVEEAKG
jgi:hypothetical protein